MDDLTIRRRTRARFFATTLGAVVVGVAGYFGFVSFVGSVREAAAGALVLAAGTGFAAFFSPCSFPLLLTFLTRRSEDSKRSALISSLRVAAGAAVLLGIVAVVVAAGGSALARVVDFDSATGRGFRLTVGLVLIAFGLRQANLLRMRMRWLDRFAGASSRLLDHVRAPSQALLDGRGPVLRPLVDPDGIHRGDFRPDASVAGSDPDCRWPGVRAEHLRALGLADPPAWLVDGLVIPATIGQFWMIGYLLVRGVRRPYRN